MTGVTSHASGRVQRVPYLWLVYFAAGVIALIVYFLLPSEQQAGLYTAVGISAALAVVIGVVIHRPAAPIGWLMLAAGQVSYATGDVIYLFVGEGTAVDVCYLGMYVFLILALIMFVRRRIPRGDSATLIDPAVLAIAAGVVWYVYVIAPLAAGGDATVLVIAYPIFDLLVLAVALRLILGTGARTPAFRLLAAGLVLMLGADVLYAVRSANGTYSDGSWLDLGWILSYVSLGAAALHPSMRWLDSRAPAVSRPIGRARLAILVAGALLPVLMLIAPGRAGVDHLPFVVAAAVLLVVLVVARLVAMAVSERQRALVDPLTGLHAMGVFRANLALEGERALRNNGQLGLVVLELDYFQLVVETYGQPAGDRVLREVAARLQARCRPGDLVARTGTHGFGVLLPDTDGYLTAQFAEIAREAVAEPKIQLESDVAVRVTASVGLAALPYDAPAPARLLQVTEQAVQEARAAGGNRSHGWRGPLNINTLVLRR
jgi:two-component system, cell cycle response regulator